MFSNPIKSILEQDILYSTLNGNIKVIKAGQVVFITKYESLFGWLDTSGNQGTTVTSEFFLDDGEYLVELDPAQFKVIN